MQSMISEEPGHGRDLGYTRVTMQLIKLTSSNDEEHDSKQTFDVLLSKHFH